MKKLFQVMEKGKPQFFESKATAKLFRNQLRGLGLTDAVVSYGPDHDNHVSKRRQIGWNRGRHPKRTVAKGTKIFLRQR